MDISLLDLYDYVLHTFLLYFFNGDTMSERDTLIKLLDETRKMPKDQKLSSIMRANSILILHDLKWSDVIKTDIPQFHYKSSQMDYEDIAENDDGDETRSLIIKKINKCNSKQKGFFNSLLEFYNKKGFLTDKQRSYLE